MIKLLSHLSYVAITSPDVEASVRFYEQEGLLPAPPRTAGNYRDYGPTHLARLAFMLRFGIAYVKTEKRLEKHVMRYPQFFAAKALDPKAPSTKVIYGAFWAMDGMGDRQLAKQLWDERQEWASKEAALTGEKVTAIHTKRRQK